MELEPSQLWSLLRTLRAAGDLPRSETVAQRMWKMLWNSRDDVADDRNARYKLIAAAELSDILISLDKIEEAQPLCAASLNLARERFREHPSEEARRDLSVTLDYSARLAERNGDLEEAERMYRESYDVLRKLFAESANPQIERDEVLALMNIARVTLEPAEVERLYRECVRLCRDLDTTHGVADATRQLMITLGKLADAVRRRDRPAEAQQYSQESVKLARQLLGIHPTPTTRRDLAVSLNGLAADLMAQIKLSDALELYRESLDLSKQLREQGVAGTDRDVAVGMSNVGFVEELRGNLEAAAKADNESLVIFRDLVVENDRRSMGDLAVSLQKLADVKLAQGDILDADRHYKECLNLRRQLVSMKNTPSSRDDLALVLAANGNVARLRDEVDLAEGLFKESLVLTRELATEFPTYGRRRQLLLALKDVVSVATEGELSGVEIISRECVNLARKLFRENPSNSAKRDLWAALVEFGRILAMRHNKARALRVYKESLEISGQMFEEESSLRAAREFCESNNRIGDLLLGQGDYRGSEGYLRASLDTYQKLPRHDRTLEFDADAVRTIERLIGILRRQESFVEAEVLSRAEIKLCREILRKRDTPANRYVLARSLDHAGQLLELCGKSRQAKLRYDESRDILSTLPKTRNNE